MIFSSPFKSFQVDSLTKRWVAFLLLILVWGVSFCFFFMPPGDPDFSQYVYWMEDVMESESYTEAIQAHPIEEVITQGNIIYLASGMVYLFFVQLVMFFYFVAFTCDSREVAFDKVPSIFFKRIWWMILFEIVSAIPFLLVSAVLPVVLLFYLPAMYAIPGLVFFEKKNPFESIMKSFKMTNGHKLPILLGWLLIFAIYFALSGISGFILNEGSAGLALVEAFITAYISLVLGRHMGIRYHMMTLLDRE